MEELPVPEFDVMMVLPSELNVKPNGCGAVVICFPSGVSGRPLGNNSRAVTIDLCVTILGRSGGNPFLLYRLAASNQ